MKSCLFRALLHTNFATEIELTQRLLFLSFLVSLAIHITGLDVPKRALVGDQIHLHCDYDERGTRLYSLKWYKNSREFYRYLPGNGQPKCNPEMIIPGIQIDVSN